MALRATTTTRPQSRWAALAVLCVGFLMIILDGTIVTVALPAVQSDLDLDPAQLSWVVNAYLVSMGGTLLLAGRLGDLLGRRRMLLAGLLVFVLASVACGLATNATLLIAARFVHGLGGAMASAVVLGMIVTLFPETSERAKAIGVYSFVGAAGASIGLVAGGAITQAVGWPWIFLVNVPIGAMAIALSLRFIQPDVGLGLAAGADVLGAGSVTAGLMLGVYTIIGADRAGGGRTILLAVLSLALILGFVLRQARTATPLLPLRIFASRNVSGANVVLAVTVAGMFGFQVTAALYLQRVLGYEPAQTGLALVPVAILIGTVSLLLAGRLIGHLGPRTVLMTGLASLVPGLALLARSPADATYLTDVFPSMLLLGIGAGLVLPAVTTLAMADATVQDAGAASGLVNTAQQVGAAVGVAVLAALAAARTDAAAAEGDSPAQALLSGYHLAFGVGAALVSAALVLTVTVLRSPPSGLTTLSAPTPGPRRGCPRTRDGG